MYKLVCICVNVCRLSQYESQWPKMENWFDQFNNLVFVDASMLPGRQSSLFKLVGVYCVESKTFLISDAVALTVETYLEAVMQKVMLLKYALLHLAFVLLSNCCRSRSLLITECINGSNCVIAKMEGCAVGRVLW